MSRAHLTNTEKRQVARASRRLRREKWARGEQLCALCRRPFLDFEDATLDHIQPIRDGGPTTDENTRLAHGRCNEARHAQPKAAERRCSRCGFRCVRKNQRARDPCSWCGGKMVNARSLLARNRTP